MKFAEELAEELELAVAPFAGAWIEIRAPIRNAAAAVVAPFAGAWIEIFCCTIRMLLSVVAPFAGAWIEISEQTPCG